MNQAEMQSAQRVVEDTVSLGAYMPVPGFGLLPVNSYLIRSEAPVLVDTGLAALREPFLHELQSIIDPADIAWIWITHVDADHVGNLNAILERATNARVITTYLGMGKMGMLGLPLDRVYLLNPGQELDVGDRTITALQPPVFDAPETTALFDSKTKTYFSADCFGALMQNVADSVSSIDQTELANGMLAWATVDAPWLQAIDRPAFRRALDSIRTLNPETILGSHLPPATGAAIEMLLDTILRAPEAPPFSGPDQAALEAMMNQSA